MQKICTLFAIALFLPLYSLAQTDFSASEFVNYQPELVFTPPSPTPDEEVVVEIGNMVSSLQGSSITWYVDDEKYEQSQNQTTLRLTAPEIDKSTTVRAVLITPSGQNTEVSGLITSRYVDIIVDAQTHTPEFYTGRSLPSVGSQINVTALLNGKLRSDFVYSWRVNGSLIDGASMRGGHTTNFSMPMDSRVVLTLDITDLSGKPYASKSILIPNITPFIQFHEVSSLYGVSPASYSSLILQNNSASVRAVPYHLDSRVFNSPDIAEWTVGGRVTVGERNPYEVTIGKGRTSGRTNLSFRVQSTTSLLQGARDNLTIFY